MIDEPGTAPGPAGGLAPRAATGPLTTLANAGVGFAQSAAGFVARHWRGTIMVATFTPVAIYIVYLIVSGIIFWDFRVYQSGIAAYQAIGTPYDPQYLLEHYNNKFAFTSPPIIVLLLSQISWLLTNPIWLGILLALHLAAWFFIPYLLLPRADRPPSKDAGWMYGAFLFALGLLGTKMFVSGNATALVSWASIGTLMFSISKRNYLPFWIVLILACQVKFLFICLAIVPFLLDKKIWQPALVAVIVAAIYASNYVIAPDLARGFSHAMQQISTDPMYIGQAVMGAVQAILRKGDMVPRSMFVPIALSVHAIYAVVLLAFAAALLWGKARPRDPHMAFLWALSAAILASPRIIENDVAILVVPYIVFFRSVLEARGPGLVIAGAALIVGVSLSMTPIFMWGGLVAIIGMWFGIGFDWILGGRFPAPARAS